MGEAGEARGPLKVVHAVRHELDAALDRGARLAQRMGYPHDPLHVGDQLALGRQSAIREPPGDVLCQLRRILGTDNGRG